jgi:restriction system protein
MPIPPFQKYLLPILKSTDDGNEHSAKELVNSLANYFNLSNEEREELLPSGKRRHLDRVLWGLTYLRKASLLESTGRGKVIITPRGIEVLSENLEEISIEYLNRFPEFQEFRGVSEGSTGPINVGSQTPEEILEDSYNTLRQELALELIERVKACSPTFFENLVIDLLVSMGYGGSKIDAGQAVGQSGDGGIDGIIKEDKLGLDVVFIQAKRWENPVGRPVVQGFAGSLMGKRANKGVLITASKFTQEAKNYVQNIEKKIVLIDGEQLSQYMMDNDIGVYEVANFSIKKIKTDYFEEEFQT